MNRITITAPGRERIAAQPRDGINTVEQLIKSLLITLAVEECSPTLRISITDEMREDIIEHLREQGIVQN